MDDDLICSWLGLPPGTWPPDHYRLLGLEPGERDAALIEQRVHERLDTVRCYQMMHSEQATQAMNRLAQAFVCLTDPAAKKTYDVQLGIISPPSNEPSHSQRTEMPDWLSNPPALDWLSDKTSRREPIIAPVAHRAAEPSSPLPPPLPSLRSDVEEAAPSYPAAVAVARPLSAAPPLEPVDPFLESAQSEAARRGIATKRALYRRIAHTRRLLRRWNDVGKYLSAPKRRLNRTVDGPELIRLLDEIYTLLRGFPALLGEAGQPGYLVLALTQVDTIKVFQSFSRLQREALSRDWHSARKLLTAHRVFLRRELRAMRQRTFRQRLLRIGWSLLVEQPGTLLLLLALLAINVALWRTYAEALWEKLFNP